MLLNSPNNLARIFKAECENLLQGNGIHAEGTAESKGDKETDKESGNAGPRDSRDLGMRGPEVLLLVVGTERA